MASWNFALTLFISLFRSRHDLFDGRDRHKQSRMMKAVGAINSEYGARMIHFGDFGGMKPQWAMRTAFCSPRYTTRWEEIPLVGINPVFSEMQLR